MRWDPWPQYVPVAERRARAAKEMARLREKGHRIEPVVLEGRRITTTFWGDAWCEHLASFDSLAGRLERGRSYVRNGSVCHLAVDEGVVRAMVMGNELYEVELGVEPLPEARWKAIQRRCAGSVSSLLDLLQGRLADAVMTAVTDRDGGLFPGPREFRPGCSCPDHESICKHVAAVFYGVGARLDHQPELLFRLRGVDHHALVADDADAVAALVDGSQAARLTDADLGDVFGIDLADDPPSPEPSRASARAAAARPRGRVERTRDAAPSPPPRSRRGGPRQTGTSRAKAPAKPGGAAVARAAGRDAGPVLPDPLRAEHVVALRERLGLSRRELGELLDLSAAAVGTWERRSAPLAPHPASRAALERVWRMSRASARRQLAGR